MLNSIEFSLNVLLEKEPKKELGAGLPDIFTHHGRIIVKFIDLTILLS